METVSILEKAVQKAYDCCAIHCYTSCGQLSEQRCHLAALSSSPVCGGKDREMRQSDNPQVGEKIKKIRGSIKIQSPN